MCIWDSYVYQKYVLYFLIHKSYVRSIKRYCFVRKYAAIPVQLEIFILQSIGWCVLTIWTFIVIIIIIIIIIIIAINSRVILSVLREYSRAVPPHISSDVSWFMINIKS